MGTHCSGNKKQWALISSRDGVNVRFCCIGTKKLCSSGAARRSGSGKTNMARLQFCQFHAFHMSVPSFSVGREKEWSAKGMACLVSQPPFYSLLPHMSLSSQSLSYPSLTEGPPNSKSSKKKHLDSFCLKHALTRILQIMPTRLDLQNDLLR